MEEIVKYCQGRLSSLKEKRQPFERYWDKAAQMCSLNSSVSFMDKKGNIVQNVFDTTARNALNCFSAAMKSWIAPSNQKYHRIKASHPRLAHSDEVKRYLQYVNDLLFKFRYAPNSRFSSAADMLFEQVGVFGQSPWLVEEDIGRGIIYTSIPMAEVYCDHNRAGVIDVVYRTYQMTLRDCIKQFGSKATAKMKEGFEKDPNKKISLLHAVEPREDVKLGKKDYTGMAFASYHISMEDNELIYEGGYRTQPYMVPHYKGIAGSAYGDSPALQSFFATLTLNEMSKTILRTAQLQSNPAIMTGDDAANAQRLGVAGAIVAGMLDANGRPKAVPMQYGNNLIISTELRKEYQTKIEEAFLKPFFLSLTVDKQMTAEEARFRDSEKAMLLAPMAESITSEWLTGNVQREIDIIQSYGLLDDVPDELYREGALDIEFESPMVRLQQNGVIKGIYESIEAAMSLSQADPSVLDVLDFNRAFRYIAENKGVPMDMLRSPDSVEALGEQRAQAEQAKQLLQAAPAVTSAMKNLNAMGGGNGVA